MVRKYCYTGKSDDCRHDKSIRVNRLFGRKFNLFAWRRMMSGVENRKLEEKKKETHTRENFLLFWLFLHLNRKQHGQSEFVSWYLWKHKQLAKLYASFEKQQFSFKAIARPNIRSNSSIEHFKFIITINNIPRVISCVHLIVKVF